jgi:predicted transcriptional regulator
VTETTFTFRVDSRLKAAFNAAAQSNDVTAAQLLRAAMRDYLAKQSEETPYDAWIKRKIARSRAAIGAGRTVSDTEIQARFEALSRTAVARARRESAL